MPEPEAAFRGEHLLVYLRDWLTDSRQREAWNDGDRGTYRFRAKVLEAALYEITERRAGLSPIARTEIERVRDEMRRLAREADKDNDYYTGGTIDSMTAHDWASALDSVLGAASTKEPK